ncbi:MAG: esterase/lipase family protein [Polyangiales bacterium]
MSRALESVIGALNGLVGDHLARTGNGLAIDLQLVRHDAPVPVTRAALAAAYPEASARVVVLVHGLMCTESNFRLPDGSDYGSLLERDLGFTPLYVRYNSGLPIADNGAALSALLELVFEAYPRPIEEIVLLGHSMGGLVSRSACHVASLANVHWVTLVRRAFYVGTPHRGAPYERLGRVLTKLAMKVPDPYVRLAAELGDLRSDGVKDLGDADLRHEDRARRRATLSLRDAEHPVPLLPAIQHHLIAGSLTLEPWVTRLFGDTMVPLASASDGHFEHITERLIAPSNVKLLPGIGHLALAHHPDVYACLRGWLEVAP